jgi:hypothetical protein
MLTLFFCMHHSAHTTAKQCLYQNPPPIYSGDGGSGFLDFCWNLLSSFSGSNVSNLYTLGNDLVAFITSLFRSIVENHWGEYQPSVLLFYSNTSNLASEVARTNGFLGTIHITLAVIMIISFFMSSVQLVLMIKSRCCYSKT